MSVKKFVYVLESGQLNNSTQMFEFFDIEIFSSQKKIDKFIDDAIRINKGYNLETEEYPNSFGRGIINLSTYNCMSVNFHDSQSRLMKVRYKVTKKQIQ